MGLIIVIKHTKVLCFSLRYVSVLEIFPLIYSATYRCRGALGYKLVLSKHYERVYIRSLNYLGTSQRSCLFCTVCRATKYRDERHLQGHIEILFAALLCCWLVAFPAGHHMSSTTAESNTHCTLFVSTTMTPGD